MWDLPGSGIQPCVPCIGRRIPYYWATREAPWNAILKIPNKLLSYLQPRALFSGWHIWSPDSQGGRAGRGADGWRTWRCNLGAAAWAQLWIQSSPPSSASLAARPAHRPGEFPDSGREQWEEMQEEVATPPLPAMACSLDCLLFPPFNVFLGHKIPPPPRPV